MLIACSIFQRKTAMLTVLFNIDMLVVSQHYMYTRTKVPSFNDLADDNGEQS